MTTLAPRFQGVSISAFDPRSHAEKVKLVTADHPEVGADEIVISNIEDKIVLKSDRVAQELTEPFTQGQLDPAQFLRVLQNILVTQDYTIESAEQRHFSRSMASKTPYACVSQMDKGPLHQALTSVTRGVSDFIANGLEVSVKPETLKKHRRVLPDKVTYQGQALVAGKQ